MCVSRSISVPLQCFAVIALLPVFGVIAPALCLADEAVDFVRQGTIERITDHVAGDYQFSMYAGFDCFRMSADGSKVLFYTTTRSPDCRIVHSGYSDRPDRSDCAA